MPAAGCLASAFRGLVLLRHTLTVCPVTDIPRPSPASSKAMCPRYEGKPTKRS